VYGNENFLHGGANDDKLSVDSGVMNTLYGDEGHDTFFVHDKETRDSSDGNRVYHASSTGLIVGLCVGAAVLVIVLAVVVRKLRGRAEQETSAPQLDAEVQVEA